MALKASGISKTLAGFPKLAKAMKLPAISTRAVKNVKGPKMKSLNLGKFTKIAKIPKAKKVALLKRAVKKVKHVGL